MIALVLAALLYAPAPLDATPAPTPMVTACAEPNCGTANGAGDWTSAQASVSEPNGGEANGAGDWTPDPAPAEATPIVLAPTVPAAVTPAPVRHLAHTGVPTLPYLAVSAALIGAGVLLRRVTSQTPVQVAPSPRSAD